MRRLAFFVAFAAAVGAADAGHGEVTSPAPDKVSVTVYREEYEGLAFVRETRTVDLPAGRSVVRFRNVADPIIPESAAINGLPEGAVERNFDYNLLSARALIDHAVGSQVRLVRMNPETGAERAYPAILRAGPDGALLEIEGKLEALRCSGAPEKLVFDGVPASLYSSPTLSAVINVEDAGRYELQLSYLTLGLTWQADYIARIAPRGDTLTLQAWITLENDTDTTFGNAPTEVVAGDISRVDDEEDFGAIPPRDFAPHCWPINSGRMWVPPPPRVSAGIDAEADVVITGSIIRGAPEDAVIPVSVLARERELADYKLYELPAPTVIAAHQTKQVYFVDQHDVRFKRLYQYELLTDEFDSGDIEPAHLVLRLDNTKAAGLGRALPGGVVHVFEGARGGQIFLGDDEVDDTPVGAPVDWELDETPDVQVETRLIEAGEDHRVFEAYVTNAKPTAVDVELIQPFYYRWRITSENKKPSFYQGRYTWAYHLRPGGSATLRYRIDTNR